MALKRRIRLTPPPSRLASLSLRVALFSLVAAMMSVIIVRADLLEVTPGLGTLAGALALSALAILMALAALIAIWHNGNAGIGSTALAMLVGAVMLAYPGYLALRYRQLPPIYDVTTDPVDPPRFEALARLRPRDGTNPVEYAGLYAADQQRRAYPEIEPLAVDASASATYEAALSLINRRKWRVVDSRAPQGNREGRIEAVARAGILGVRDDVVLRIRADGDAARVDMRSASRYFRHDLGVNASRIRGLLDDINETVDDAKPATTPQPAKRPTPAKGQARR